MQTPISYFTELINPRVDRSIADFLYMYINQLFTSFHSQNKCNINKFFTYGFKVN
jgi:hypothetical protein